MLTSGNVNPDNNYNEFAQQVFTIQVGQGASLDNLVGGVRMPWAGKVISAAFYCATITDADDSIRVKPVNGSTDMVAAAVDPVAANTLTAFTLTAGTTFAAGDVLKGHVLTAGSDAIVGTFTFVVRPYLGRAERAGASLLR